MNSLIIILFSVLIVSCSHMGKFLSPPKQHKDRIIGYEILEDDYLSHLAYLGEIYLNSSSIKRLTLSEKSNDYLGSIYQRIIRNNELILDQVLKPSFYIVKSPQIFFFSLPKGQFFFSKGLVDKYFRNEEIMVACLSYEIIKSHRGLYKRRRVVPVGYIDTEKILSITRIPHEARVEINKLAYFVMKRAGYDPSAYLNWLQTQNKNTLDFSIQLGDGRNLSREEFLFKNFLVLEDSAQMDGRGRDRNSSQGFYVLINEVMRTRL